MENQINDYNNNENNIFNFFKIKKDTFPNDRKSLEYKKINQIRTNLLKIIDKEAIKYSKHMTMINSKTTPNFLKTFEKNYTINLKTKEIKSTIENGVSFDTINISPQVKKLIDFDLHPFIFKCNHHYHRFKKRKKVILSKQTKWLKLESQNNSPISPNDLSPNRERHIFMITGKIRRKFYFDYLHSLFFSLHKNYYSGKVEPIVKYASGNLCSYTSEVKKFSQKLSNNTSNNLNHKNHTRHKKPYKKANSNNELLSYIHLIKCEKK